MKCRRRNVVLIVLSAVLSASAIAWKIPVHPRCPGNDPSVSWKDYMSAKFHASAQVKMRRCLDLPGVEFRYAKKVADPAAIGNLRTDACYAVRYTPNVGYLGVRNFVKSGGGSETKDKLPGNPLEYEINIYGVMLLFNEAGEVLNHRGKVVGTLVCYVSNECGGY